MQKAVECLEAGLPLAQSIFSLAAGMSGWLTVTGSPKPIFHKIDLQYLEAFGEPKHTLRLTDARERGCQACDTGLLLVSQPHLWPLIG